jgi:PAS domain S-box-containing protein
MLQSTSDGRFLDANEAFLTLTGHSRAVLLEGTATSLELWPGSDVWQQSVDSISLGEPLRAYRTQLRGADGATRHVLVSVAHAEIDHQPSILTSVEDITERLRIEDELRKAQKMEAVGQLAAGIAHDFNNLLTVIQSHAGNALADPLLAPAHRLGLTEILAAAERAGALTRQLLVSSRNQITQPKPVNVAACVANLRPALTRLLPTQIQLQLKCDRDTPAILGDEANLEHLIVSLVTRARDGLPDCGRIRVALHPVEFDAAALANRTAARPGRFVCLSVGDNGNGISPTELKLLAEPFSTTLPANTHPGAELGLGSVYAIVREHCGWIEVTTAPGVGTTFEVFLPALDSAAPEAQAPELRGNGQRILLVEDEPGVRLAMRLTAERAGYRVTEAGDAPTARQTWTAAAEPFDLLITDIVMPNGANGIELASELRALQPSLRIVLATGYSRDLLAKQAAELDGIHLIQKPCTPEAFLATMHEALETPVAAA